MYCLRQAIILSAVFALANGQNVVSANGKSGGTSTGLQVNQNDPNDMNIIKSAEIGANVVNQCGRTVQGGNIDVGAKTEDALAAGNVTQVEAGGNVNVVMSQGNAMGAGPFNCDLDPKSNVLGAEGQTPLSQVGGNSNKKSKGNKRTLVVRANKAQSNGQLTMTIQMPKDLACIGASTGNVCTVRCINQNEVGGCFAVQQINTPPSQNNPGNINTAQQADAINKQIDQNNKDLPAAQAAIANTNVVATDNAGQGESVQAKNVAAGIISADPTTSTATAQSNNNAQANKKGAGKKGAGKNGAGKNKSKNNKAKRTRWAKRFDGRE